jgi:hypothetical protein
MAADYGPDSAACQQASVNACVPAHPAYQRVKLARAARLGQSDTAVLLLNPEPNADRRHATA